MARFVRGILPFCLLGCALFLSSGAQADGLSGEYYDNMNFTVPKLTRTDATVNFNWGNGSPHASMGIDTFSVRWTGQVQPQFSQSYTFYTRSDDGVRLWVGGQLLIDKWVDQAPTEWSGTIALSAGQRYDLKLEFLENVGEALVELRWSSPSTPKQIIPANALFLPGSPSVTAVSVAATDASASEPGTNTGSFTLTRTGSTSAPLTVNVSWGGTATNGSDYSVQPTTLSFAAGAASVPVTVVPTNDSQVEPTETIMLAVAAGAGYQVGSPASATVNLADDDGTAPPPPSAPTRYVRAGATGSANGSDWVNAFPQLPATLTRGTTYYVASGNYPGYSFDDPVQGSTSIVIQKATASDHGTDVGWQASYGVGQAMFGPLTFGTGQYVVNGRVGGGPASWTSGHGFKVKGTGAQQKLVRLGAGTLPGEAVTDVRLSHIELEHRGRNTETSDDGLYGFHARNISLSDCYVHDLGRVPILMRNWNNVLVERCYVARNSSSAAVHSEGISDSGSDNVVIRHNVWKDIEGTAVIVVLESGGAADNWQIYGNVFAHSIGYPFNSSDNGLAGGIRVLNDASNTNTANNWVIHNNSIVGIQGLWSGFRIDAGTNNVAFNNLWYNSVRTAHTGVTLSHSWYFNTNPDGDTANAQTGTGNPFRNLAGDDFHLVAATAPGRSLSFPYDTDMENTVRGAGGTWDRGALEHSGSSLPVVSVTATDASASEPGTNTGSLTLTRSGSMSAPLTVSVSWTGTATNGTDYSLQPTTLTFAAGAVSLPVTVVPADDAQVEAAETIVLTVASGASYQVGSPSSATVSLADNDGTTPPPPPPATGLSGEYYNNMNFTTLKLTRTDATVNFNWGNGSPHSSIGIDTFSVRWTGQVQPQFSQTYTFYTRSDDGVRLWVGGQLLIDKWVDQAPTEWSGTVALVAGQRYDLKLEFLENVGGALVELRWSSPSTPKQIIPASVLFLPGSPSLPTVSVAATDTSASEPGTDTGSFTLTRSGSTSAPLTVNVSWGGTATNGSDYSIQPTTLSFAAGAASAPVTVVPTNDAQVEAAETIVLTVAAGAGYQVGSPSSATLSLADDDVPFATTRYVRAGATGSANGSDWVNAFAQLPATLTRGTTYFVASGTYPGYTFDDPQQGSTSIAIQKATAQDHGTDVGWQASYGVGQATFGPLTFSTGHYFVNGRVGGGPASWTSGHGFKVKGTGAQQKLVRMGAGTLPSEAVSDVRLSHIELEHRGRNTESSDDGLYGFHARNVSLSDCYLHDLGRAPILMRNWNNVTIERCYVARNSSSAANHSAGIADSGSDNVVIRHNVWKDIEGTAVVDIVEDGGATDNWEIYGNVFVHSVGYPFNSSDDGLSGVIRVLNDASNSNIANNWNIHNNSVIGIQGLWSGFRIDAGANNVAFNNLWYNSVRTAHFGVTLSHSWYFNTNPDGDTANAQTGTGNPFRNLAGDDFHLIAPTAPGRVLSFPYDTDMEGTVRGAGGTWDRGALEHSGSSLPVVSVTATDASASEPGTNTGSFTLTRSGSMNAPLTVSVSWSGTATNGSDYSLQPTTLTFAAGAASLPVTVVPADDAQVEAAETIVLTVASGASYQVGSPSSATVNLADDDGTTPPPPPATGLSGEYYDNMNFTVPKLTRTDATVNFNWGNGSPHASMGIDTFSVRWTGQVQPQFSQSYTFYTRSDDGVRLWVGGQLLIDKWVDQAPTEWSGTIALSAGQRYDLKLEFLENVGGALVELRWSSLSTPKQIIPASALFLPGSPSLTTVSVAATDASASEPGTNTGSFTLTRTGSTSAPLTVNVSWGGTATNGTDYSVRPTTLSFAAGAASVPVTVVPTNDAQVEAAETIVLAVAAGAGYQVGSPGSATVSLADDDIPSSPTRYVRAGATGAGNGTDWDNAFPQLPATLTRGTTYYVASGTYPGYAFDDPVSGQQVIRIVKATEADHGTDDGWSPLYDEGPAAFGPISFDSSHWVFDGRRGSGTGATEPYGFRVSFKGSARLVKLVRFNNSPSHITVSHVDMEHAGAFGDNGHDIIYSLGGHHYTFSYCYLHDVGRAPILLRGTTDLVFEHSYVARNESNPAEHSEAISAFGGTDRIIIRHSVFEDIEGTGAIMFSGSGWEIYGNVIFFTAGYRGDGFGNGAIATWSAAEYFTTNIKVYNNVFANLGAVINGGLGLKPGGNVAYNNLWYRTDRPSLNGVSHDYNSLFECSNTGSVRSEVNGEIGRGDPFVNLSGRDFRLKAPTLPGLRLPAPYDKDGRGVLRGGDGMWDRGAFEFVP